MIASSFRLIVEVSFGEPDAKKHLQHKAWVDDGIAGPVELPGVEYIFGFDPHTAARMHYPNDVFVRFLYGSITVPREQAIVVDRRNELALEDGCTINASAHTEDREACDTNAPFQGAAHSQQARTASAAQTIASSSTPTRFAKSGPPFRPGSAAARPAATRHPKPQHPVRS